MRYLLFFLFFTVSMFANIGKVSAVKGEAEIVRNLQVIKVKVGTILEKKDTIHTKKSGKVQLIFNDNTTITIGKNSALNINEYLFDAKNPKNSKTDFNFFKGAFKTITGKIGKLNKKKFKLRTKNATIGIRGTVVVGNQSIIACTLGGISVESAGQIIDVDVNQFTTIKENEPPTPAQTITSETMAELDGGLESEEESSEEGSENEESSEESQEESSQENASSEESAQSDESDNSDNTNSEESNVASQEDNSVAQDAVSSVSDTVSSASDSATESSNSFEEGTISLNSITSDNILTLAESKETVTLSGTATGGNIQAGDVVTLKINGTTYTTTVNSNGTWSVDVNGTDIYLDDRFPISILSNSDAGSGTTKNFFNANVATMYTYTGSALGSNVNSSDSSKTFINRNNGTFIVNKELNVISYEQELIQEFPDDYTNNTILTVSNSITYSDFDPAGRNQYTGHSNIGSLPFSYTITDNPPITGVYDVEADNMGEFFVLSYDGVEVSGEEFNELIVVGKDKNLNYLNTNRIYVYKNFRTMNVEEDFTTNVVSSSFSTDTTDTSFEYYNAYLKSLTHFDKKVFENGADTFSAGNGKEMVTYFNEYSYDPQGDLDESIFGEAFGDAKIKGTAGQGLAVDLVGTEYEAYNTSDEATKSITDLVSASFLDNKDEQVSKEGTLNMTGMVSYWFESGSGKDTEHTSPDFSLSVDRTTGNITGGINLNTNEDLVPKLVLNGMVDDTSLENDDDLSAYYISDDLFGVLADTSGSTLTDSSDTYTLIDKTGYLIAVPDGGFDNEDNPIMLDDDSSWGYWTAKYDLVDDQIYVSPLSTWVAGIETSQTLVQGLLDNVAKVDYDFTGHVIGTAFVNNIPESILMDATNNITLNFDLGGGINNMTGNMKFNTANSAWDMNFGSASNQINSSGFTADVSSGGTGSLEGKFFGEESLKSVGGNFNVTDGTNKAQGSFKASN